MFFLENPLIEKLLKFFVAVVDAELLEGVDGKVLEAGNVQDPDEVGRSLERNTLQGLIQFTFVRFGMLNFCL